MLAQQLTPGQREELDRKLPAGFLERDAEFHEMATGLEHAAHRKQADLVPFYVYKLTEGRVGCHARFAQTRFPALAPAHAAGGRTRTRARPVAGTALAATPDARSCRSAASARARVRGADARRKAATSAIANAHAPREVQQVAVAA